MSTIPYHVVQRVDPRDPTQPRKYYANVHLKKTSTYRDLIKAISNFSTVNPPDVQAVLESMIHIIPEMLTRGEIVRLGEFGSFYLRLTSQGFDTEEEVSSDGIKKASIRFRSGSILENAVRNATFRKFNPSVD